MYLFGSLGTVCSVNCWAGCNSVLFGRGTTLFPTVATVVYIPAPSSGTHYFTLFSVDFLICFCCSRSLSECEVMYHCDFELHSSNDQLYRASFQMAICITLDFNKSFSRILSGTFLFSFLRCKHSLYILKTNPLYIYYLSFHFSDHVL